MGRDFSQISRGANGPLSPLTATFVRMEPETSLHFRPV
jgi:hypothetical protein